MIDAMKQALEALDKTYWTDGVLCSKAFNALRQAIADAEKQYGWVLREVYFEGGEPLAHREPQESTLQEMSDIGQEIEKSTNSTKPEAESNFGYGLQEPVAWMYKDGTTTSDPNRADGTWTPLYTAPPKQENELDIAERAYFAGKQAGIAEAQGIIKLKEKNT